jgi:uncharacterized glyoxalase superfamily protein PhnB
MPGGDDMVMNMSLKLGSATVMASDSPESMFTKPQGFRVSISPKSREEFDRVHDALAEGAQSVEMAPARPSGPNASPCSPTGTARPGCWASKATRRTG